MKKIRSALVSVFSKDGLDQIAQLLHKNQVTIYSTGGTAAFFKERNIPVIEVESLTEYPSILGGRVKTLHPKIFGGILARSNENSDEKELAQFQIPTLDLVVVDLYPFEDTLKSGASESEIIEKIDIGGVSLIRAAAKNFNDVVIIPSKHQYRALIEILSGEGSTNLEQRKKLAFEAFKETNHYDGAIASWIGGEKVKSLRYGENPHQSGSFIGRLNEFVEQVHGKELSYNNILDIDAAMRLIRDFQDNGPSIGVIKHNNACGFATRKTAVGAYLAALEGDPVSAFGGIIISNTKIDLSTAEEINKLFCEVVIAPDFEGSALELLRSKKNRILLIDKLQPFPAKTDRSALNGTLEQDYDSKIITPQNLKTVTTLRPSTSQIQDLIFANKLVKHTKSNTIVLAKKEQLLASGVGQTSRVDALRQAIAKAKSFGFELNGAVMASDAFFPFPDCVEIANLEGINTVIQPGGSVKDRDSIEYCDAHNMSMVFTGIRHFKH